MKKAIKWAGDTWRRGCLGKAILVVVLAVLLLCPCVIVGTLLPTAPTPTPMPAPTSWRTYTPVSTATATDTPLPTDTPTVTSTPLPTGTSTLEPTATLVPTPTPTVTAAPTLECPYIGNSNTKVFHHWWCSSVKRMKEGNKVCFKTREQAVAAGYVPCKRCNP